MKHGDDVDRSDSSMRYYYPFIHFRVSRVPSRYAFGSEYGKSDGILIMSFCSLFPVQPSTFAWAVYSVIQINRSEEKKKTKRNSRISRFSSWIKPFDEVPSRFHGVLSPDILRTEYE